MIPRKWNDEDLVAAVRESSSITGVLRRLSVAQSGQSQRRVMDHIARKGLDTSHWVGTGGNGTHRIKLEDILVENSTYVGHNQRIRKQLVESGVWEDKCSLCGTPPIWQGRELTLTVDHINGVSNDHRIENLRLLCPNCHSQTETFGAKNGAKGKSCIDCTEVISYRATRCKPCSAIRRRRQNEHSI